MDGTRRWCNPYIGHLALVSWRSRRRSVSGAAIRPTRLNHSDCFPEVHRANFVVGLISAADSVQPNHKLAPIFECRKSNEARLTRHPRLTWAQLYRKYCFLRTKTLRRYFLRGIVPTVEFAKATFTTSTRTERLS